MTAWSPRAPTKPEPLGIDENGVDRAQIRAMLALTPEERLKKVEDFLDSALEIRELSDARPVR